MHRDMNLVVVAGAGDSHISPWIVYRETCACGKCLHDYLVAFVFVAEKLVKIVLVDMKMTEEGTVVPLQSAEEKADQNQQNQQRKDTSAHGPPIGGLPAVGDIAIEYPLQQQDDAEANQQYGPPVSV